jgi:S1-C subfamily serine protease
MVLLLCMTVPTYRAVAQADLKQYVALIETNYHKETRDTFVSLANYFSDQGSKALANYFRAQAQGGGFGTGWVYVAGDGENFIITNRHVVSQAATVNIKFEQPDGSYKIYENAPIVYADDYMDLAVVQFPGRARVFSRGFPIDTSFKPDGTQLFSAGFPAFGGSPLWQFSTGIVTNSRARPTGFTGYDYLVQHSAQIDSGNSGGPLMVRDPSSVTGFAVIGVNTWKALQRENTNFSIPAKDLPALLSNARKAIVSRSSGSLMRGDLERACEILASELRAPKPATDRIDRFISYAIVGRRGWSAFEQRLQNTREAAKSQLEKDFLDNPIEVMRTSLFHQFWTTLKSGGTAGSVAFESISAAGGEMLSRADAREVLTDFTEKDSSGTTLRLQITWTWEYGHWRVLDFQIPQLAPKVAAGTGGGKVQAPGNAAKPKEDATLLLVGGGFRAGISNGYGSIYSYANFPTAGANSADQEIFGWSAGAAAELVISYPFWVEARLNLTNNGRYYHWHNPADANALNDIWVHEQILYIQIPLLAKLRLLLEPGFGLVFSGGPAVNLAVSTGGTAWDYYDVKSTLSSTWYDGFLNPFALSVMAEVGMELGFGNGLVGFAATVDYHLTNDFNYSGVSDSSHFLNLVAGAYLRFPVGLQGK